LSRAEHRRWGRKKRIGCLREASSDTLGPVDDAQGCAKHRGTRASEACHAVFRKGVIGYFSATRKKSNNGKG